MFAPTHGVEERGGGGEPVLVMKRGGELIATRKREERVKLTMKEREAEKDWYLLFF